jgi:hypothetical protein
MEASAVLGRTTASVRTRARKFGIVSLTVRELRKKCAVPKKKYELSPPW